MTDLIGTDVASLLAVSFGVGIVIGLTGMGGGALMTPALIFLGVPPSAAVANDLVAAAVNKSVGAAVHWRKGSPNVRLAGWLIAGSVPTAFVGAFIIDAIGTKTDQESFLRFAVGCALLLASSTYAFRIFLELRRYVRDDHVRPDLIVRPVPTLLIGMFGGLCVGLTSVGSGSLMMVALLILYPTLSAVKLVGTDLGSGHPAGDRGRSQPCPGDRRRVVDPGPAHRGRIARHVSGSPPGQLGVALGDPPWHHHGPGPYRFVPSQGAAGHRGIHWCGLRLARPGGLGLPAATVWLVAVPALPDRGANAFPR